MDGNSSQHAFLDLFCGCGGFSLGVERAGFRCLATIVAHLSKDGLMFVHPTQNRSLTPREAAHVVETAGKDGNVKASEAWDGRVIGKLEKDFEALGV